MVTNARSDELDLTVDRCHALEAEVARLTAQLEAVSAELADERSHSASLKRVVDRAKVRIKEMEQLDRRFSEEDLAGTPGSATISPQDAAEPDEDDGVDLSFGKKGRSKGRGVAKAKRRSAKGKKRRISNRADENVYVFDDHDESRVAFDEFFSNPDPHLDKVRGFLLD